MCTDYFKMYTPISMEMVMFACDPGPIYNRIQTFMKIYEHGRIAGQSDLFVNTNTSAHTHIRTQYGKESGCTRKQIAQTLHNKSTVAATFNACYRLQTTKPYTHTHTYTVRKRWYTHKWTTTVLQ